MKYIEFIKKAMLGMLSFTLIVFKCDEGFTMPDEQEDNKECAAMYVSQACHTLQEIKQFHLGLQSKYEELARRVSSLSDDERQGEIKALCGEKDFKHKKAEQQELVRIYQLWAKSFSIQAMSATNCEKSFIRNPTTFRYKSCLESMLTARLDTLKSRRDDELTPWVIKDCYPFPSLSRWQELADAAVEDSKRWDAVLKSMSRLIPREHVEEIFSVFVRDTEFGGHFIVLKAHIYNLISENPSLDHFRLKQVQEWILSDREVMVERHLLSPEQQKGLDARAAQTLRIWDNIKFLLEIQRKAEDRLHIFYTDPFKALAMRVEDERDSKAQRQDISKKGKKKKKKKKAGRSSDKPVAAAAAATSSSDSEGDEGIAAISSLQIEKATKNFLDLTSLDEVPLD